MCMHNLRDKTNKEPNIDQSKTHLNEVLIDKFDLESTKDFGGGYAKKLTNYYDSLGIKQRKDAVQAMEFVLTASPEFFKENPKKAKEWVQHQVDFMKKEFGKNLKFAVLHKDESSDHIHFVVSTEITKTQKFKNRHGTCEKEVTSLNAKRFNRNFLIDLHTRYAKHNEKFGLIRGVRGSEADHLSLKEHRKAVSEAETADYAKDVDKQIDKVFGGKNLLGLPKTFNANEIKEGFTPFLNTLIKKQKHLKAKAEKTNKSVIASAQELAKEKQNLADLKSDYFDAVNSKAQDLRTIAELQKELKQWKPEQIAQKDLLDKSENTYTNVQNLGNHASDSQNSASVKKPKIR